MGDKACITAAIAVGYPAVERLLDLLSLVIVQALGRYKGNPDTQVIHFDTARVGMCSDMRQSGTIAEQHFRFAAPDLMYEPVQVVARHFKGGQQAGTEKFVTR